MSTNTPTLERTITLGPLSAAERHEIMRHAPTLQPEARRLFRRLLIVGQAHGLDGEFITRSAAQARAHFE
ncbi:MAG: hypothetical protein JOZ81_09640 [Chloroflexi bacterium]|nr:hypothetical protein [Chloroflexota bacterium]MBV9547353.1 hypothetical protein [Chloroflexota bacterium]